MRTYENSIFTYSNYYDGLCVTINTNINRRGNLVMGKGIAKEIKNRFPGVDKEFGYNIKTNGNKCFTYFTGTTALIGFITKLNWWEPSDIKLILRSAEELNDICDSFMLTDVLLPAPGCGNGSLDAHYVKNKLDMILDDRIIFCYGNLNNT